MSKSLGVGGVFVDLSRPCCTTGSPLAFAIVYSMPLGWLGHGGLGRAGSIGA